MSILLGSVNLLCFPEGNIYWNYSVTPMGTRSLSQESSSQDVALTTHPVLLLRSHMSRRILLYPQLACLACMGHLLTKLN